VPNRAKLWPNRAKSCKFKKKMNSNFNISNRFYRVGLKYKPYKTDVKNEILAKLKIKAITLAEASREYEVPKSTIKHWLRNLSDNLSQNKDVTTNETTMIIETITEATTSTTRNKSTSTMTDDYPKVDKEQQTDCNDKNDKETETEAKTTMKMKY
jgi:transposase-like protein